MLTGINNFRWDFELGIKSGFALLQSVWSIKRCQIFVMLISSLDIYNLLLPDDGRDFLLVLLIILTMEFI